jgi:hypothetical protein
LAQPDFVVVAGDWTYEPENKLAEELAILKRFKHLFIQSMVIMMSNILDHLFKPYWHMP